MMKAIYDSVTTDELGKGLQMKSQDELLGRDGAFVTKNQRKTTQNISAGAPESIKLPTANPTLPFS